MKTVVAIVAAMIVSSAITYIVTDSFTQTENKDQKGAEKVKQSETITLLRAEIKELEASKNSQVTEIRELKASKDSLAAQTLEGSSLQVPGVVTDPEVLINQLADGSTTGADVKSQKRVIHYFESLVDGGENSLPAIANFMNQRVDKEFGRPSFRQQLNITNAQMEEMRAFGESQRDEMRAKMGEIWGNQELTREERGEKMREIFSGASEKFMELMTDDQKAQIEEMGGDQGDRIRMMMRSMGGGDRGGRPGGDRGGGRGGR